MSTHTIQELRQFQAMPLEVKVAMTKVRIRDWVNYYGQDGVYVSFSGGKDSTVLLHLVREEYPNIPAVFVDTGLEYPEIREFVKTFDNVTWLKPKMNFKKVIEKYGYPFISKEVSECVYGAKKYLHNLLNGGGKNSQYQYFYDKVCGSGKYSRHNGNEEDKEKEIRELANLLNQRMLNREGGQNQRLAQLLGWFTKDKDHPISADEPHTGKDLSKYSQEKWKFLLFAPFDVSNKCCNVMKKEPAHRYIKETGKKPILATMAEERRLRTQKWLQNGCNGFEMNNPVSTPMAFWTEQDILNYIKEYNIPMCSVYGDIVVDYEGEDQLNNQIDFFDLGLVKDDRKLKTTGCSRTGCMFCGFGCHLEKPGEGRFELMKKTHPQVYDYVMRSKEKGGLNYKEIIDWCNENGGTDIRY